MIKAGAVKDVASVFCPAWGYDAPKSDEEALANAQLISAAPELLEALEFVDKIDQQLFDVMPVAWQTVRDNVQNAISKARGTV